MRKVKGPLVHSVIVAFCVKVLSSLKNINDMQINRMKKNTHTVQVFNPRSTNFPAALTLQHSLIRPHMCFSALPYHADTLRRPHLPV